ncbi:hypothetical protein [Rhizobacter sp. OV335]|uniref:hypothetical protein n=1 Tax=Rhizobacter sp. OV335 TaxID=1500264 RepID=UPI0009357FCC|nr:hypothetical protein [Rhizobacter sp. OV335]
MIRPAEAARGRLAVKRIRVIQFVFFAMAMALYVADWKSAGAGFGLLGVAFEVAAWISCFAEKRPLVHEHRDESSR